MFRWRVFNRDSMLSVTVLSKSSIKFDCTDGTLLVICRCTYLITVYIFRFNPTELLHVSSLHLVEASVRDGYEEVKAEVDRSVCVCFSLGIPTGSSLV